MAKTTSKPGALMKPTRTALVLALGWALFWLLMVTVEIQDYWRDGGDALWRPILWDSSSMVAATLLLFVQRRLARRYDDLLDRPARWFAVRALFLPMYWAAFVPIAFGIRHAGYALMGEVYRHEGWGAIFFYESVKLSVFVCLFVLVEFGLLSYRALLEEKLRMERASALLRQAQLTRLTAQMQPHFLFNALNTISSLMHSDVQRADATLIQLAEVLRTTLDLGDAQEAPLATELRLVRGYARVMEERYGERVSIAWQIDDAALACLLPVMSLQPLLENVFKHTVERRRAATHIVVSARCTDGSLRVAVRDDGGRLDASGASGAPGLGLANLRERLAALYGGRGELTLRQLEPAGVLAELTTPASRTPCAS
ncbi:MAG: sensor histidine kinase [Gammaproteobacteria bacterium]